jgi:hypothetical protein
MNLSRRIVPLCGLPLLAAIALGGCQPTGEEALSDNLDDFVNESNEQNAILCDCWQQLGYMTQQACTDTAILPARRRCIEDALAEDVGASNDRLECQVPLMQEYTACLNERLACDDIMAANVCGDDYNLGLEECVNLPNSVIRDYDACFM